MHADLDRRFGGMNRLYGDDAALRIRAEEARRRLGTSDPADLGEAPQFSLRHWTPGEEHGNRDGHSAERGPGEAPTPNSLSAQPPARKDPPLGFEERRKADRRQQNIPVLLDTRLSPCRRETDRQTAISLKA